MAPAKYSQEDGLTELTNRHNSIHRSALPAPGPLTFFRQSLKSDAYYADELINIYLLRPIAAGIVWILVPTRVTPNQVTILAVLLGFAAAAAYAYDTPAAIALAGLLIVAKDITDDADGQLARAKEMYSRRGRFLDSIGDFLVNLFVFAAISDVVAKAHSTTESYVLGFLAFIGISLRVSYHVYYQVSFLHLEGRYKLNRIAEDVTEEDEQGDQLTLYLQRQFVTIYSWQDHLMTRIDRWCMRGEIDEKLLSVWYGDRFSLRLSGLLGFGTELMLLAVCSWLNALPTYLLLNVFLMNGIWLVSIFYRRFVLSGNLK